MLEAEDQLLTEEPLLSEEPLGTNGLVSPNMQEISREQLPTLEQPDSAEPFTTKVHLRTTESNTAQQAHHALLLPVLKARLAKTQQLIEKRRLITGYSEGQRVRAWIRSQEFRVLRLEQLFAAKDSVVKIMQKAASIEDQLFIIEKLVTSGATDIINGDEIQGGRRLSAPYYVSWYDALIANGASKTVILQTLVLREPLEDGLGEPLWMWTTRDYTMENSLRPKRVLDSSRLLESFTDDEWIDMKSTADFLGCIGLSEDSFVLYVLLLKKLMGKPRDERHHDHVKLTKAGISCALAATTKPQFEVSLNLQEVLIKEPFTGSETGILYSSLYSSSIHELESFGGVNASHSYVERGSKAFAGLGVPTQQRFGEVLKYYSSFLPIYSGHDINYLKWSGCRTYGCVMWCKAILLKQNLRPLSQSVYHLSEFCISTGRVREYLYCYLWQCYLMKGLYTEYDFWKQEDGDHITISACELLLIVTDMICKNCIASELYGKDFAWCARYGIQKTIDGMCPQGESFFSDYAMSFFTREYQIERLEEIRNDRLEWIHGDSRLFRTLARKFVEESLAVKLQDMSVLESQGKNHTSITHEYVDSLNNSRLDRHIPATLASSLHSSQVSSYRSLKRLREQIRRTTRSTPQNKEAAALPSSVFDNSPAANDSRWSIDELSMSFTSSMNISTMSLSSISESLRPFLRPNRHSYQPSSDMEMVLDTEVSA
jgi:hypothetical protein